MVLLFSLPFDTLLLEGEVSAIRGFLGGGGEEGGEWVVILMGPFRGSA